MYHYFMTQRSFTTNVKISYNLYNYFNYLDNYIYLIQINVKYISLCIQINSFTTICILNRWQLS